MASKTTTSDHGRQYNFVHIVTNTNDQPAGATDMNDRVVRIPGRLWPAIEELSRENLRSPPDMVRYLVERGIIARQMKKQQQS
jgi:hypothetical protein